MPSWNQWYNPLDNIASGVKTVGSTLTGGMYGGSRSDPTGGYNAANREASRQYDRTVGRSTEGSRPTGYFWKGADGKVYVQGQQGINDAGNWDANTVSYWTGKGFVQTPDSASAQQAAQNTGFSGGDGTGTGGGGGSAPVLDAAGLASLDALLASLGVTREQALTKAKLMRDTRKTEKDEERRGEKSKYDTNKLETLQDFGGALNDTNINTRNTLENLLSAISTLGLGGSRALTRQILDAANISRREANATQARDNQNLDSAWDEYDAGYETDIQKIEDQYGYDVGEADTDFYKGQQDVYYKKGDIYGDADMTNERANMMSQGDSLNSKITGATFLNPGYTGKKRKLKDTELGDYTQDIAQYETTGVVGADASPLTPVKSDGMNRPGNLAVRAIAVNDKDLGIKKKSENDLGYGV